MGRLNGRHLDARRTLRPRDYLEDPFAFGLRASTPQLPDGGDECSQRIALVQHQLVMAWRRHPIIGAGDLCRHFGIHRNTWSQTVRGYRWAGETVLAAITYALITPPR